MRHSAFCLESLETRAALSTYWVSIAGDSGGGNGIQGVDQLHGDLRYCIVQANSNDYKDNDIKFAEGMDVNLNNVLTVSKSLTIDGAIGYNGTTSSIPISGDNKTRLFNVFAPLTLKNLDVTQGYDPGQGGHLQQKHLKARVLQDL